ncbi:uncharacterized protein K452DRAFT_335385 [Aplosporella prunicola CBS 121167]|uniref:Uncharacterized protein n=1 Tax=Aplosporella prunicola CBS 121167 TaxID=1176127 RepID=A0A6A6BAA3_9PEZI|nr:uncharacterized protein K452DRAFT_335385 [Aplosporella prunicola CBS 121167]KAF2140303.1 hypothetical protein K452DRAFT_335385 [Aplosporella prunicola CBS 121167]
MSNQTNHGMYYTLSPFKAPKVSVLQVMPLIERVALLDSAPIVLTGQTRTADTGLWKGVQVMMPRDALIAYSSWAERYIVPSTTQLIIPGMVSRAALRYVVQWICAVGEKPLKPLGSLAEDLQVYKVLKALAVPIERTTFLNHILRYLKSGNYIAHEDAKVEDIMVMWENFSDDKRILQAVLNAVLCRPPDPEAPNLDDIEVYICRNPDLLREAQAVYYSRSMFWSGFLQGWQQNVAQLYK